MLDQGIALLKENEKQIIYSDQGCHYRWPGWIKRMEKSGLIRSMSKKDVLQIMQPVKDFLEY